MGLLPADIIRYYRVDRRDLVYLKFILEAYEGMSTMSTVDRDGVIVRITIPVSFENDMDELLAAIAGEIPLAAVDFTAGDPPGDCRQNNRPAV